MNELFNSDKRSPIEIMISNKRMEFRNDEFKKFMLDFLDELIEQDRGYYPSGEYFYNYFSGIVNLGCDFDDIRFFIYDVFGKLISYNNSSPTICEPIIRTCEYFPDPSLIKYLDYLDIEGKVLNNYLDGVKRLIEERS